jgi:hypothetical protein
VGGGHDARAALVCLLKPRAGTALAHMVALQRSIRESAACHGTVYLISGKETLCLQQTPFAFAAGIYFF